MLSDKIWQTKYEQSLNMVIDTIYPPIRGLARILCERYGVRDIQPTEWRLLKLAIQEHISNAIQDWANQFQQEDK